MLESPLAVTTMLPVVAAAGTVTVMLKDAQLDAVAAVPLNVTVLEPCVAPNPDPVITTVAPAEPVETDRLVIVGWAGLVLTVTLPGAPGACAHNEAQTYRNR
jgi:hypothetical protein